MGAVTPLLTKTDAYKLVYARHYPMSHGKIWKHLLDKGKYVYSTNIKYYLNGRC